MGHGTHCCDEGGLDPMVGGVASLGWRHWRSGREARGRSVLRGGEMCGGEVRCVVGERDTWWGVRTSMGAVGGVACRWAEDSMKTAVWITL